MKMLAKSTSLFLFVLTRVLIFLVFSHGAESALERSLYTTDHIRKIERDLLNVEELLEKQESKLVSLEARLKTPYSKRPLNNESNSPKAAGDDCEAIFLSGTPILVNGYYTISSGLSAGSGPLTKAAYCDFLVPQGQMTRDAEQLIQFEAVRDSSGDLQTTTGQVVTYDRLLIDTRPGFMNAQSGVFTAPVNGKYSFYFEGQTMDALDNHFLSWTLNGQLVEQTQIDEESQNHKPFYNGITLDLIQNDQVQVVLNSGGINCNPNVYLFHFGGKYLY